MSAVADALAAGALVCPVCHGRLAPSGAGLACGSCGYVAAVVDGIPVLLHPESAFAGSQPDAAYFAPKVAESPAKRRFRRSLPSLAADFDALATDELVRREMGPGEIGRASCRERV